MTGNTTSNWGCITICLFVSSCLSISELEFHFLQDFYNSTNGQNWYIQSNWNFQQNNMEAHDICNSSKIFDGTPHGISCCSQSNISHHICQISFKIANNLNGTIPPSIQNLTYLNKFVFRDNHELTQYLNQYLLNHKWLNLN